MKEKQKQRQQQKKIATQHQQRLGKRDGPPKIVVRKKKKFNISKKGLVTLSKQGSTKNVTNFILESQDVKHSGTFIQTLV